MSEGTGLLTKPVMFLSSYTPLFVILVIRFDSRCVQIACVVLALAGLVSACVLLHAQREKSDSYEIKSAVPAGAGAASYLSGYLLPFVTVSEPKLRDLIAYSGFLVVAYFINFRTALIQVNPLLFILGWTVYSITDEQGFEGYLLSKTKVIPGDIVVAYRMTDDVLLRVESPPETQ